MLFESAEVDPDDYIDDVYVYQPGQERDGI